MSTTPISTVLPATRAHAPKTGGTHDAAAGDESFSTVLRQSALTDENKPSASLADISKVSKKGIKSTPDDESNTAWADALQRLENTGLAIHGAPLVLGAQSAASEAATALEALRTPITADPANDPDGVLDELRTEKGTSMTDTLFTSALAATSETRTAQQTQSTAPALASVLDKTLSAGNAWADSGKPLAEVQTRNAAATQFPPSVKVARNNGTALDTTKMAAGESKSVRANSEREALPSQLRIDTFPEAAAQHPDASAGMAFTPSAVPILSGNPAGFPTAIQQLNVSAPLQSAQWPAEFGRQMVAFTQDIAQQTQTAELRLDPPELGPIRITININDNIAHALFVSPHASVRQSVENALPQLQQLMEQAGISLGQADVSDQGQADPSFAEAAQTSGRPDRSRQSTSQTDAAIVATNVKTRTPAPGALVDTFA